MVADQHDATPPQENLSLSDSPIYIVLTFEQILGLTNLMRSLMALQQLVDLLKPTNEIIILNLNVTLDTLNTSKASWKIKYDIPYVN